MTYSNLIPATDWFYVHKQLTTQADAPPVVRTRHLSTPVNQGRATRWLYEHGCAHVVVTGEALKQQLVADNGFPAEHMTSVPTGIDTARFHCRLVAVKGISGESHDLAGAGYVAEFGSKIE